MCAIVHVRLDHVLYYTIHFDKNIKIIVFLQNVVLTGSFENSIPNEVFTEKINRMSFFPLTLPPLFFLYIEWIPFVEIGINAK